MTTILGLDVGGAHLKAARLEDGTITAVTQALCPLWQGTDRLEAALAEIAPVAAGADRIAVTMTGELSDIYENREVGVRDLVDRLIAAFGSGLAVLALRGQQATFASPDEAKALPSRIGSMNFMGTAWAIAPHANDALLIDFGSTTCDLVVIRNATPHAIGLSDAARQETGELVYTGATRTSVIAVAQTAPFAGRWTGLAREHLATMSDVRRILGENLDGIDLHATADGRGRSRKESLVRFARMFGRDIAEGEPLRPWLEAARFVRERQIATILDGALLRFTHPDEAEMQRPARAVVAGIGATDAAEAARRLGLEPVTFGDLIGLDGDLSRAATHHAPAVATALLLSGS